MARIWEVSSRKGLDTFGRHLVEQFADEHAGDPDGTWIIGKFGGMANAVEFAMPRGVQKEPDECLELHQIYTEGGRPIYAFRVLDDSILFGDKLVMFDQVGSLLFFHIADERVESQPIRESSDVRSIGRRPIERWFPWSSVCASLAAFR